jgi:hypothetical protein
VPNAPLSSQRKPPEKPAAVEKSCGQQESLSPPDEPVTRVRRSQHDIESFRPLPPVPSASTLQLPSFLNFSTTHSLTPSSENQPPPKSSRSLPVSILFRQSSSHVSVPPVVIRKTKNAKVYEGPQWIPAFHNPNSPYVPWPSPVRRRILLPLTPESPTSSHPCSRSGAVAPEPWSSHSNAETVTNVEKRSSSWKNFVGSIRSGIRSVKSGVSRIGKVHRFSRRRAEVFTGYGDDPSAGDCAVVAENTSPTSLVLQTEDSSDSRVSLGSLVSSDSTALAAWLTERHTASDTSFKSPGMSLEEYEMMGSWLDLPRGNGDWVCGVQGCYVHTPNGSVGALCSGQPIFRTAMPFDATVLESLKTPMPKRMPLPISTVDSSTPLPFRSLPLLPFQGSAMSPKILETSEDPSIECVLVSDKSRELNMPGGWMFTS